MQLLQIRLLHATSRTSIKRFVQCILEPNVLREVLNVATINASNPTATEKRRAAKTPSLASPIHGFERVHDAYTHSFEPSPLVIQFGLPPPVLLRDAAARS